MDHKIHFYESRPLLADWLYRSVRDAMQLGDMCVVIARPDIRESLERLLDLDFDVTAASAWGLYAYVDTRDVLDVTDGAAGFDDEEFSTWLAGIAAEAGEAERRVSIWSELGELMRKDAMGGPMREIEALWGATPSNVRSVTSLYRMPPQSP